uniref:Uncharacterized protein n=1 Tax=Ciona savignyi TaxID=51511 RepID=H2YDJ3_CIOSA
MGGVDSVPQVNEADQNSTEETQNMEWVNFLGELIHETTSMKVWPKALKKNARVSASIETEERKWVVWKSDSSFHVVFGVPHCKDPKKYFYMKPSKRSKIRDLKFKLGIGNDPTKNPPGEMDKRVFVMEYNPKNGKNVLRHLRTNKYLFLTESGKLDMSKNEEKASRWEITGGARSTN